MKSLIKAIVLSPSWMLYVALRIYDKVVSSIFVQLSGAIRQPFINYIDNDLKLTQHGSAKFYLYTPNSICKYRHATFSTKEPEMLEWIEEFGGGVFFDIGANIGIYSLYYSQVQQGNIYCFEPSAFNLRQLAKNVSINNLHKRITIISNPLSDKTCISSFINGTEDEGGALSAFGVDYGYNNEPMISNINYSVLGFSLDDLFEKNILKEIPSLMKIDVDGIEHLILKGASKILESKILKSVYIEVNDEFHEQSSQVKLRLETAGFKLKERRHAASKVFNQIWVKE
jgi:FkbM family methyltransferase